MQLRELSTVQEEAGKSASAAISVSAPIRPHRGSPGDSFSHLLLKFLQPERRIHLRETLHEIAVSSASIYGLMGLTGFAALPLYAPWVDPAGLKMALATAAVSLLAGTLFFLNRNQLSLHIAILHMIPAVGMTTFALFALGKTHVASAISMIYILTALHGFHFFSLPASLGIVAYIGASFYLVADHYQWIARHGAVILLIGCCITAGVVINLLVRRLHRLATTDKLTQAYNRHTWDAVFDLKMHHAKRYGTSLTVMIIDLDEFKRINDTRGHQEGDRILRKTAQTIRECLRASDIFARWGGDEFIILLDGCSLDQAGTMETRLRSGLEQVISFTCGSAELRPGDTTETLLYRADKNLLQRKTASRG